MNVTKNIPITERVKFAVGASLFNLFNHPNFDLPLNNVTAAVLVRSSTPFRRRPIHTEHS